MILIGVASSLGACSKKKNKNVHPPTNQPPIENPPPPVDPGSKNGSGNYDYCGAISQNQVNPYTMPGQWHFDYQYNVNWFVVEDIATYWYQGYYWVYGNCNSVDKIFGSYYNNYYYDWMVYNPTPCATCTCIHCGNYDPYTPPNPSPSPSPSPNPSPSCGSTRSSYSKTHSIEQLIGKNDASASDSFYVPVTQPYYIEVYGLYTGVTQKNETMSFTLDNNSSKNIRDLNDQTNIYAPDNTCRGKCYYKVCLSKGTHTVRFKGTNQSIWLKSYKITTTKPSSSSCS